MSAWSAFAFGLVAGALVGFVGASLCTAARDGAQQLRDMDGDK